MFGRLGIPIRAYIFALGLLSSLQSEPGRDGFGKVLFHSVFSYILLIPGLILGVISLQALWLGWDATAGSAATALALAIFPAILASKAVMHLLIRRSEPATTYIVAASTVAAAVGVGALQWAFQSLNKPLPSSISDAERWIAVAAAFVVLTALTAILQVSAVTHRRKLRLTSI